MPFLFISCFFSFLFLGGFVSFVFFLVEYISLLRLVWVGYSHYVVDVHVPRLWTSMNILLSVASALWKWCVGCVSVFTLVTYKDLSAGSLHNIQQDLPMTYSVISLVLFKAFISSYGFFPSHWLIAVVITQMQCGHCPVFLISSRWKRFDISWDKRPILLDV